MSLGPDRPIPEYRPSDGKLHLYLHPGMIADWELVCYLKSCYHPSGVVFHAVGMIPTGELLP